MKTKFSPLVDLKKKDVELIERKMQEANYKIASCKEDLNEAVLESNEIQLPQNGDFFTIRQISLLKNASRIKILSIKEQIIQIENYILKLKQELQRTQIEYEKFNHIHLKEVQKKLEFLALQESKELDEIALMLNKSNKKKRNHI